MGEKSLFGAGILNEFLSTSWRRSQEGKNRWQTWKRNERRLSRFMIVSLVFIIIFHQGRDSWMTYVVPQERKTFALKVTDYYSMSLFNVTYFRLVSCDEHVNKVFHLLSEKFSLQTIKFRNCASSSKPIVSRSSSKLSEREFYSKWKLLWFEALLNDSFIASNVNFNNFLCQWSMNIKVYGYGKVLCNGSMLILLF